MFHSPIYLDQYFPATATLEVMASLVIRAIGEDAPLMSLFVTALRGSPDTETRIGLCREFLKNIEYHRGWANKHLWWLKKEG